MDDRSFLYGDGLFESVRVRAGKVEFLAEHIDRFRLSARVFEFSEASTQAGIAALETLQSQEDGMWRVTVSRDVEDHPFSGSWRVDTRWRALTRTDRETSAVAEQAQGSSLISLRGFYHPEDWIREHKTTSFLKNVEGKRRAIQLGFDDGLMVAGDGRVGETTTANIFLIKDGEVVTPFVEGILPGVVRAKVIQALQSKGVPFRETVVSLSHVYEADALFLTSSGVGICEVSSIDGRLCPGSELAKEFERWVFDD